MLRGFTFLNLALLVVTPAASTFGQETPALADSLEGPLSREERFALVREATEAFEAAGPELRHDDTFRDHLSRLAAEVGLDWTPVPLPATRSPFVHVDSLISASDIPGALEVVRSSADAKERRFLRFRIVSQLIDAGQIEPAFRIADSLEIQLKAAWDFIRSRAADSLGWAGTASMIEGYLHASGLEDRDWIDLRGSLLQRLAMLDFAGAWDRALAWPVVDESTELRLALLNS